MAQYNTWQALWMSFYSRKIYRDIATQWGGKSFAYLLLLLSFCWILTTYDYQLTLKKAYDEKAEPLFKQAPEMTIIKGEIHTPENRPYFIVDPNNKETIAIIDTTGQYTEIGETKIHLLITKNQFIYKPNLSETRIYSLNKTTQGNINPEAINPILKKFVYNFSWIVIFLSALLCSFIYRIIQALLYSLIGKIGCVLIRKVDLTYNQILSISLVSITPTVVLSTLLEFCRIEFNYQNLMYFLLSMFYLYYGISANKKDGNVK